MGSSTVIFHGHEVSLPQPAGLALLSAGSDVTHYLPSWQVNAPFDIFSNTCTFLEPGYRHMESGLQTRPAIIRTAR